MRLVYTAILAGRGSSVGCASAWYADGRGFDPHVRQHTFLEFGHEIISLPSADSRKAACALSMVNCLGGLLRNSVDRLTDGSRNALKFKYTIRFFTDVSEKY